MPETPVNTIHTVAVPALHAGATSGSGDTCDAHITLNSHAHPSTLLSLNSIEVEIESGEEILRAAGIKQVLALPDKIVASLAVSGHVILRPHWYRDEPSIDVNSLNDAIVYVEENLRIKNRSSTTFAPRYVIRKLVSELGGFAPHVGDQAREDFLVSIEEGLKTASTGQARAYEIARLLGLEPHGDLPDEA